MDTKDIIEYFDNRATQWDNEIIINEKVIENVLDNVGIKKGVTVLDVACGTGVLFPYYIRREVSELTAIDISPKMVEIAKRKFPAINVLLGDVEKEKFDTPFDCVMVYNAFPHFPDPVRLIKTLAKYTKQGGKLSVAHGMSRDALLKHHEKVKSVSLELPHAEELAEIFSEWFEVDKIISNAQTYQVVGIKK